MAATMEMQSIFLEFGVGTKVREYTLGLEVRTQQVFVRFAATEDDLRTRLISPCLAKLTDPDPTTKALVEAAVLAARDAANVLRTTAAAATKPPFLLVTTIAAQPSSFAASIPSSLRPHQLAQQTAKYENPWTPPRTFPVKILLGAEGASASPHSRPLRGRYYTESHQTSEESLREPVGTIAKVMKSLGVPQKLWLLVLGVVSMHVGSHFRAAVAACCPSVARAHVGAALLLRRSEDGPRHP